MAANRVDLKQLAQDGATDGQVATWSAASNKWIPTTLSTGTPVSISQSWFDAAVIDAQAKLGASIYSVGDFVRDDQSESLLWPYSASAANAELWQGPDGLHTIEAIPTSGTGFGHGSQYVEMGGSPGVFPLDPTKKWYIAAHMAVVNGGMDPAGEAWIGFKGSSAGYIKLGLDNSDYTKWSLTIDDGSTVQRILKGATILGFQTLVGWYDLTNYNFTTGLYTVGLPAPTSVAATAAPSDFMGKYLIWNLGAGGFASVGGFSYTFGVDKFIAIQRDGTG